MHTHSIRLLRSPSILTQLFVPVVGTCCHTRCQPHFIGTQRRLLTKEGPGGEEDGRLGFGLLTDIYVDALLGNHIEGDNLADDDLGLCILLELGSYGNGVEFVGLEDLTQGLVVDFHLVKGGNFENQVMIMIMPQKQRPPPKQL